MPCSIRSAKRQRPFVYPVLFLALLCAQGFPSAAPAWAETRKRPDALDFKDADIHALIKYISEATGPELHHRSTVKGKVTVYSCQDFPG